MISKSFMTINNQKSNYNYEAISKKTLFYTLSKIKWIVLHFIEQNQNSKIKCR